MPSKSSSRIRQRGRSAHAPRKAANKSRQVKRSAGTKKLRTAPPRQPRDISKLHGDAADLADMLAGADIPLVYVDGALCLRGFTPAMADLLDVTSAEVGQAFSRLKLKFQDEALRRDLRSVLTARKPREAEIVSASGRAYVRRALPYRLGRNRKEGVVITFMDVTRRKVAEAALRSSEERHRLILESVAEYAILILDPQGRFLTWSAQAQRILGYTAPEVVGRHLALLYDAKDRKSGVAKRELAEARERRSVSSERWHLRKDGSRFWATEVLSALYDEAGRMYGFVKVLRDNTDRKRVEQRLQQAKAQAELANTAKDVFLANVSHELRTPLSATLLWAKLLTAGASVPNEAQIREGLDAIVKSALEQQALIEDLMDTSRIVAGKLRLELKEFDLPALVHTAIENARPAAQEKGLHLDASIDANAGVVRADPLRLQQVLGNLLNNAVKFTPTEGHVTLSMRRDGPNIAIDVADTGQGIAAEFLPRIFDLFTQGEQPTIRTNGGMGLGLAIVRQLVELHGGRISVESDGLAKGSTFRVRLPLPRVVEQRNSDSPRPFNTPTLDGLEVLLVEDIPDTRRALAAVLRNAGARVVETDSAQAALKAFNERRPDLILSDIGLGKISGHELIHQIRSWEKAQKIPAVPALALTAYADQRNRELALFSGFQQVVTKPIEPAEVVRVLASLYELA